MGQKSLFSFYEVPPLKSSSPESDGRVAINLPVCKVMRVSTFIIENLSSPPLHNSGGWPLYFVPFPSGERQLAIATLSTPTFTNQESFSVEKTKLKLPNDSKWQYGNLTGFPFCSGPL